MSIEKTSIENENQPSCLGAVSGSLRNDRIKEVAKEIANSKTKGFSEEWEKFREEEYKYWLKRIRWATRSNDR